MPDTAADQDRDGGGDLQADIGEALRSSIVLPPYGDLLRQIDGMRLHLIRLVARAELRLNRPSHGDVAWYQERRLVDNARYQLEVGPGDGLASAARFLQSLARSAQQICDFLPADADSDDLREGDRVDDLREGDCVLDVQRNRQGILLSAGPDGYDGVWLRPLGGGREWRASRTDVHKLASPRPEADG